MKSAPKKRKAQTSRFSKVVKIVCGEYHITEEAFMSERRFAEVVSARFHYWHILHYEYGMNHSQIAREFGMTHGAVINGLHRIEQQFQSGAKAFKARNICIKKRLDDIDVEVLSAVD